MGWKVYITREIPKVGLDVLGESCELEVSPHDRPLSHSELMEKVRDRDGIISLLTDPIDREVLEASRAKIFSNYAVGYDNIDVQAASELGIMVTNTPGVLTDTTAELAWALIFSVARRVVEGDRLTRGGGFRGWAPMLLLGTGIGGKTLGILGAGRIGTAVALKSRGLEMPIVYTDLGENRVIEKELKARKVDLDDLLKESDFLTVHLPLSPETHHLIGERELGLMKENAILINTSRGPVVDEAALVRSLKEERIRGAGLDVYEREPELSRGLAELDNVVLSPHAGSATVETRGRMAIVAAENLLAGLAGETPPNLVNPEVLAQGRP